MKPILVIDDDIDIREVIIFALENEGFSVLSAENGKVGLETLLKLKAEEYPGLIIVDYLMPEMNGLEFIQAVKSEHRNTLGKIPIIISSAMGTVESEENQYMEDIIKLYKPMDLDDLLKIAHQYC